MPATKAAAVPAKRRRTRDPRITLQLVIGASMLLALILVAVIGPLLVDPKLANVYAVKPRLPPGAENWLGSDTQGRDLWTVMVLAIPNTLKIGLIAGIVGTVIGVVLALIAGFFGGLLLRVSGERDSTDRKKLPNRVRLPAVLLPAVAFEVVDAT